jgi:hypothetical protein
LNRITKIYSKFGYWVIFAALLSLTACETADKSPKFSKADNEHIDTTAAKRIRELTEPLDSLCKQNSAALVQRIADSLVAVREAEIRQQIPVTQ